MEKDHNYTLQVIKKGDFKENFDFDNLSSIFTYNIKEAEVNNDGLYDVVLDTETLELYHGFNKELIVKLDGLKKISKETEEKIISEIKKVDFDTTLAIEMLGGSERVFKNILGNYLQEYNNVEDSLIKLLELHDFDGIRKIIHKIKGVSLYLGSEKLLYMAQEIENKIFSENAENEDILDFIKYHNRMLEYVKAQV